MKKITLLFIGLLLAVGFTNVNAQEDCATKLSLFAEDVKAKNYESAEKLLGELRANCPKVSSALYAYGEKVYKNKIKKAAAGDKQTAAKELIKLYEDRIANVPAKTKKGDILSKIGKTMMDYKIGTPKEQYDVLDKAFTTDLKNFKNPKTLYKYFELYYNMYKAGEGGVQLENVISKFEDVNEKFEYEKSRLAKVKNELIAKQDAGEELNSKQKKKEKVANTNLEAIGIFSKNVEALVEQVSTCETLIPLFRKNFDANRSNAQWLRRAAGRLDAKGCDGDPLFVELVEAIDALQPSADTKYYLYKIYTRKGDSGKADQYFNQTLELETDSYRKSKLLYKIANNAKKNGQKSKARKYYQEALKHNPSLGSAYLKIANMYASSANQCGKDTFDKLAIYWKAAALARKAGQVDPSLKKNAAQTAASYAGRAPKKADIFAKGYKGGETITFNCWVGGSVKVPNL